MSTESKKPNNPYAFPIAETKDTESMELGMTLRDYFANSAMQTPVSYRPANLLQWIRWAFGFSYEACDRPHGQNAIKAYELADAMLKQREL